VDNGGVSCWSTSVSYTNDTVPVARIQAVNNNIGKAMISVSSAKEKFFVCFESHFLFASCSNTLSK
jgi:hypothetical protein